MSTPSTVKRYLIRQKLQSWLADPDIQSNILDSLGVPEGERDGWTEHFEYVRDRLV